MLNNPLPNSLEPNAEVQVARPLSELVKGIKDDLAEAERAGLPYFRAAGEKLIEAKRQLPHGEFQSWIKRNFKITPRHARRYMDLAGALPEKGHASPFSSLNDFIRADKTSNGNPNFTDELRARSAANEAERKAERKLWLQIVDAGYKAIAVQFHPDKGGSSKDMTRLNKVRALMKARAPR